MQESFRFHDLGKIVKCRKRLVIRETGNQIKQTILHSKSHTSHKPKMEQTVSSKDKKNPENRFIEHFDIHAIRNEKVSGEIWNELWKWLEQKLHMFLQRKELQKDLKPTKPYTKNKI